MDTKSQEWIEATQARIREVFDLFDKDKSDSIVQEEVLNVMRGLGVFPTDKAVSILFFFFSIFFLTKLFLIYI